MSALRAEAGAPRSPDLRPRVENAHADAAEHGRVAFVVTINGVSYNVRPQPFDPEVFGALVRLQPRSGSFAAITACEWANPELGLDVAGFLGLGCDCPVGESRQPCVHIRALKAVGILRPAPTWDEADELLANLAVAPVFDDPADAEGV